MIIKTKKKSADMIYIHRSQYMYPRSEVIKLFSCSAQLSVKFQMLISIKISRNSAFFRLR